jgi:hypothetical protein
VATATVALLCLVALAAGLGAWRASRQGPLPAAFEGPCQVRAVVRPGEVTIDPTRSAGVYRLPASGSVTYEAVLAGTADPGRRRLTGRVTLDLPPPLPDATLARWDEPGGRLDTSGVRTYALPRRWAPTGLTLRIGAEHREPGLRCAGELGVRVAGSAAGSLLRPITVFMLIASAWLLARATLPRDRPHDPWRRRPPPAEHAGSTGAAAVRPGASGPPSRWNARGRPGVGLLAGLVFGTMTAVVLLLSSAIALQSTWVTVSMLGGMVLGLALGWWGGPATPPPEAPAPAEAELPLLEPIAVELPVPGHPPPGPGGGTNGDR